MSGVSKRDVARRPIEGDRLICERVKQARVEAGLSQEEMANLLHLTLRAYQFYESASDPRPPFRRLSEIADITGVSQAWLLRGDSDLDLPTLNERLERIESSIMRIEETLRAKFGRE